MSRPNRPDSAAIAARPQSGSQRAPSRQGRPASAGANGRRTPAPPTHKRGKQQPTEANETEFLQHQLEDILRRQAEVEDRHQGGIVAYRHTLRQCYNENSVLRNIITAAEQRRRLADSNAAAGSSGIASVTDAECEHLQLRINLTNRRVNRIQYDINRMEQELYDGRCSEQAAQKTLREPVEAVVFGGANRTLFLRIQKLEKRLNDILTNQSTIGAVVKGYEHHIESLREEGKRYDGWIQHVEKEFADRHRDHTQLAILYQNATASFQKTANEEQNFQRNMTRLRHAKERALAAKQNEVTKCLRETQRLEQRLGDAQQQLEEESQQMESAEEQHALIERRRYASRSAMLTLGNGGAPQQSTSLEASTYSVNATSAKDLEKITAYEHAFRTMMQRAGVNQLEELAAVFEKEHKTRTEMQEEADRIRAQEAKLKEEIKSLKAKSDTNRYCTHAGGVRQPPTSHLLREELRAFIREEETKLQKSVAANEGMETLLAEVVRRVNGIAEKTASYRADVTIPPTADAHSPSFLLRVSVLTQKLLAIADDATRTLPGSHANGVAPAHTIRTTQLVIPENNLRVPLKKGRRNGPSSATLRMLAGSTTALSSLQGHLRRQSAGSVESVEKSWASLHEMLSPQLKGDDYDGRATSDGSSCSPSDDEEAAPASGHLQLQGMVPGAGRGGAAMANDDPLRRDEIKRMSEAIQRREKRRREKELRRAPRS